MYTIEIFRTAILFEVTFYFDEKVNCYNQNLESTFPEVRKTKSSGLRLFCTEYFHYVAFVCTKKLDSKKNNSQNYPLQKLSSEEI